MRTYNELTNTEKVRAILACSQEPLSREEIIELTGIKLNSLTDAEQGELLEVMNSAKNPKPEGYTGPETFFIPEQSRAMIIETLGVDDKSFIAGSRMY